LARVDSYASLFLPLEKHGSESRMTEAQTRFIDGVLLGIEDANSHDTVDHEEVRTVLERLIIS
jgi:hypothetical protein